VIRPPHGELQAIHEKPEGVLLQFRVLKTLAALMGVIGVHQDRLKLLEQHGKPSGGADYCSDVKRLLG